MMLERNQVIVGVVVTLVATVGAAFGVLATAGMFVDGDPLRAEFRDAAGLTVGDVVDVGGHRAGQVTDVHLDGDRVLVAFTSTVPELPADTMAEIAVDTALGRRSLTLVPGTSGDILEPDSLIPLGRTSTPVDLPELGDRSAELLTELDVPALRELTTAVADITEDSREDLDQLLDGVEAVSSIVSDRREELAAVLDRATTLVDAAASKDTELVAIIDDFGAVLDRLVDRRSDITRLLQETARTSTVTADLVAERRAQIDQVVGDLSQDLELIDRHQVDLAHTLAYLPAALEGFSSIGYSGGDARIDNPRWGNVFATNLGSIGIGSMLECGGALDRLFTDLLAPDPRCEHQGGPPTQGPEPGPPVDRSTPSDSDGPDASSPTPAPDATSGMADALDRFLGLPSTLLGGEQP